MRSKKRILKGILKNRRDEKLNQKIMLAAMILMMKVIIDPFIDWKNGVFDLNLVLGIIYLVYIF